MARPLGEISAAVLTRLAQDGPMTMRELASIEQIDIRAARWTMDRLVASGRVVVIESSSVAWARRPVARYALPMRLAPSISISHLWGSA
jgi:predicted ArsR family transcriptional regulator